ncbi:MAG: TolC family protein [Candidatus Eisenbacteria bacterium]|nr:TolC family protein [Candidatus Eisenbacteria bacterium]
MPLSQFVAAAAWTANSASEPVIPDPFTLPAALELARQVHPDLNVARANLAVVRADSLFARLPGFNPEIEFQSSRGGQSLGSGTDGSLEVGVAQELELWGKRGARQSVATARSRKSAAELSTTLQQVESNVRAQFERALFLQDRLETLGELIGLDRRVLLSTQARVREGLITPVTGRLTELDVLRLEAQSRRTRSDRRQALVALGLAIGLELPESTRLGGELRADSLQMPEDSVIALALRVRGESEVLRRQIDERRAELHLAEREARPNLTVGAGLAIERQAFAGDDFSGDPVIVRSITGARDTDRLWRVRVSVPLPLFQKNQAGRARAAAEVTRSQADYDRFRSRARLEVIGAVRRFEDAAGLYRLYLGRSGRVREDLSLVRDAYADGRISLDSYLTQKGRLVDTMIGQLEAADAYWEARGALEATVGLDLTRLNAGGAR